MTYTYVKEHNILHILNLANPINVPVYPGQYMPRKLCYPGKKADLNYLCKEGISMRMPTEDQMHHIHCLRMFESDIDAAS